MLVLSRRLNEAILIGDKLAVRVMGITADTVRLGNEPQAGTRGAGPPLSCRKSESLALPGNVTITVVGISPDRVRLGIEAPVNVPVYRLEYHLKVMVVALKAAIRDGRAFLTRGQYLHLTDIVRRLADWNNPVEISDLRIEPIQGLWVLKEKGGILGRINVRVFFAYLKERREIVVLGAFKKENEDQTPRHILIRMQNRLRVYLEDLDP